MALDRNEPLGWATITHPFHPLRGQRVEVVRMRRGGSEPELIIRLPDGLHTPVAMSLTDYATPPELNPAPGPLPLLDVEGLRQMVQLIDHLRQQSADLSGPCSEQEPSYD